jgi:aspartate 1-decarboxylase
MAFLSVFSSMPRKESNMQRTLLKSKIHRATVTAADLNYEGSITVDRELLEAADICENEQVHVYNVSSGERLVTYAIEGEPGSGHVQINGAAAHKAKPGDLVIIASYAHYSQAEAAFQRPRVVRVDAANKIVRPEPLGALQERGTAS